LNLENMRHNHRECIKDRNGRDQRHCNNIKDTHVF